MNGYFNVGDIVWAKMKGFPPWPATIINTCENLDGIPFGRYSLLFFGTRETAIMKANDLFDYDKYRKDFEVSRKTKGFDEALKEARLAFELIECTKIEQKRRLKAASATSTYTSNSEGVNTRSRRSLVEKRSGETRRKSESQSEKDGKAAAESIFAQSLASMTVPHTSESNNIALLEDKQNNEMSPSGRRKRNSISTLLDSDLFEDPMLPMLSDAVLSSFQDGFGFDSDDYLKSPTKSHRKCVKMDDLLSSEKSRERVNSTSSSGRTRLLSGMSDLLEGLLDGNSLNQMEVMALNDIMLNEDREINVNEQLSLTGDRSMSLGGQSNFIDERGLPLGNHAHLMEDRTTTEITMCSCGFPCALYGVKWRCTNNACLKWNGTCDPFNEMNRRINQSDPLLSSTIAFVKSESTPNAQQQLGNSLSSIPDLSIVKSEFEPDPSNMEYSNSTSQKQNGDEVKSSEMMNQISQILNINGNQLDKNHRSSASTSRAISRRIGNGRPRYYKVEQTPQIDSDGRRHCNYCSGQVRPQMCGGNKHRWRCVDKRCRKWYGWVLSNEEIPTDLGKKGRWKNLVTIRRKTPSPSDDESQDGVPSNRKRVRMSRSGKGHSRSAERPRSLIERKARWWLSEKRNSSNSPERKWDVEPLDAAAAFRVLARSMSSAANTRINVDEPGTLSGALDLLMDALLSSMGPFLTLLSTIPELNVDNQTLKRMWESTAVHTPLIN